MTLNSQTIEYLNAVASLSQPLVNPTVEQLRADPANWINFAGDSADDVDVRHTYLTTPTADIHTVVFTPSGVKPDAPALVYYHGGGWVLSWILRYSPQLSRIASETGAVVIGINYQKAPEHPFPTPFNDCYAGLLWVRDHAKELSIDPNNIGVAGDSAGGNLAAAVALKSAETGDIKLAFQALLYPCVDTDFDSESYLAHKTGFGLEAATMQWFWNQYLPPHNWQDRYAVPIRAENFSNVAPAIIALAEHDVLRDDGLKYAEKLLENGVAVSMKEWPGMIHGFFNHGKYVDDAHALRRWLSDQMLNFWQPNK